MRDDGGALVGGEALAGAGDLDGRRKPVEIPAEADPKSGRVLVQAFVATEADDAIPVDQVVLVADETAPVLQLPDGEFRLVVQDEKDGKVLEKPLER